jgi:hypothetical protein
LELVPTIRKYFKELASEMGINLLQVSVIEGRKVGCLDVHLVNLVADGQRVSTLVYQSEFDELQNELSCLRLEIKIKAALSRLKILLEP